MIICSNFNFPNIIKNELFNDKDTSNIYLKYYCRKYYLIYPEESTDITLAQLSKKFSLNYDEEINKLHKYIKLAKQYMYDNKDKIKDFIFNLEDMVDNKKRNICFPYGYKTEDNKKIKLPNSTKLIILFKIY